MGIFSFFRKGGPPDYETLLAQLSTQIEEARVSLSEVRLRERRWSLLVNLYGIALWAVLVGLWWTRTLPLGLLSIEADSMEAKIIGASIVGAAPVLLWLLNRALHFVFARQRNSSERHLRDLLTEQRKHLDAIKKATNYDSTRKLIERYDELGPTGTPQPGMGRGPGPQTPIRGSPGTPTPSGRSGQKGTPRAPGHLAGAGGTPAPAGPGAPGAQMAIPEGIPPEQAVALQQLQMQAVQPVLPTPEKKWYDRVVDSILGDDPSQAPHSKYALVCGECFRHNGLVGSKQEWERMQWICPRCNHMNPSPLSRQTETGQPAGASTPAPARDLASPVTPSHLSRASPKPRRNIGERGTPKTSRLGQEVFSASAEEEEPDEVRSETMDVDEK